MSAIDKFREDSDTPARASTGDGEDWHTRRFDRRALLRAGATLAGVGFTAGRAPSSRAAGHARAGHTTTGAAVPPNILVIVVDQMRAPRWFGVAGSADGLPANLARLRQGAVTFARHYTASNDCTPARAALLTGLHAHQTGCLITGVSTLDPRFPTWGTMLRDHGYATYWFGKWHLTHGDGGWTQRDGPTALERYGFAGGTYPSPNGAPGQGREGDSKIARQFERWYRDAGGRGPWCTTVSFVNPHDIAWWYRYSVAAPGDTPKSSARLPPNFETPAELRARRKPLLQRALQDTAAQSFGPVPFSGPNVEARWAPLIDLYASLQREVDVQVGTVLSTLASRPQVAANTIVVFTSDHGEYAGSHGLRGKGAGVYEEAIRVPLIVNDPRGRLTAAPKRFARSSARASTSSRSCSRSPVALPVGGPSDDTAISQAVPISPRSSQIPTRQADRLHFTQLTRPSPSTPCSPTRRTPRAMSSVSSHRERNTPPTPIGRPEGSTHSHEANKLNSTTTQPTAAASRSRTSLDEAHSRASCEPCSRVRHEMNFTLR